MTFKFIEWTENGQYHGANYREDQVGDVLQGIVDRFEAGAEIRENTIWVDDEEIYLQRGGIGCDEFPQHTEGYDE